MSTKEGAAMRGVWFALLLVALPFWLLVAALCLRVL